MTKPRLLYYVHAHGAGHRATFNLLYPQLHQTFEVIAVTTHADATNSLSREPDLTVIELPPKWPTGMPHKNHTFSKAFEETPYAAQPAERVEALLQIVKQYAPVVFYCDGSPELAIVARGIGVPVVLVHLPGHVMADPTQVFAYELADHIIAHFPSGLEAADYRYGSKTYYSGYLSKYAEHTPDGHGDDYTVTILMGYDTFNAATIGRITADKDRRFVIIGNRQEYSLGHNCRQVGRVTDIAAAIEGNIVITAAGQNSVAELLSLDKRLILLPEPRPYDEQVMHAQALAAHGLALIADFDFDESDWSHIIDQAATSTADYDGLVNAAGPRAVASQLKEWYA